LNEQEYATMNKQIFLTVLAAVGVVSVLASVSVPLAQAQGNAFVPPVVFQASGPSIESIQGTVDDFRAALGEPNNANAPGPLLTGRREINWDGGGADTVTGPVNPFEGFLNSRGARFGTPGKGLSQAPPSGGPQNGLAGLFSNDTYGTIFSTFSPLRLFTPVGSNITQASFFVPGTNGAVPATVTGFGAIFTDVDQASNARRSSTLVQYFDAANTLLFASFVPASPGDGSLSFYGVVFEEARIRRVRITTGNRAPGPDDSEDRDIVMMDDFFYGEPQPIGSGTGVVALPE
jgi:hypothetical protein